MVERWMHSLWDPGHVKARNHMYKGRSMVSCSGSNESLVHSLAYPASGFAICWTVLLTGVLTESYKGLTRKRTKHELRPLGMLTHKS